MQYEREKHAANPQGPFKKETTSSTTVATVSTNTQPGTKGGSVASTGTPSRTTSQNKTGTSHIHTSSGKEARLSGGRCYSSSKINAAPSTNTVSQIISQVVGQAPISRRLKRISEVPEPQ